MRRLRIREGGDDWKSLPLRGDSALSLRRARAVTLYPQDRLYQEMAFLAYYLHWSGEALMDLSHWERRRWCQEVSAINRKLSGNDNRSGDFG